MEIPQIIKRLQDLTTWNTLPQYDESIEIQEIGGDDGEWVKKKDIDAFIKELKAINPKKITRKTALEMGYEYCGHRGLSESGKSYQMTMTIYDFQFLNHPTQVPHYFIAEKKGDDYELTDIEIIP